MLLLWPLLLLINFVLADVNITAPTKGQAFSGKDGKVSFDVQWTDNGAPPSYDDVDYISITLNQGPNNHISNVGYLQKNMHPSQIKKDGDTYSVSVEIDAATYADGQYFLQVYTAVKGDSGGNTINYSPRFVLKDMKAAKASFTYSGSTQPPDATNNIKPLAYTKQTGITRTAPMQMQPGTKVTATTWSRKFPTSAVSYFPTLSPTPHWETTLTPGWSYKITSHLNHNTPRKDPSENGGWYDAKKRQSLSTRKVNMKSLIFSPSSTSST